MTTEMKRELARKLEILCLHDRDYGDIRFVDIENMKGVSDEIVHDIEKVYIVGVELPTDDPDTPRILLDDTIYHELRAIFGRFNTSHVLESEVVIIKYDTSLSIEQNFEKIASKEEEPNVFVIGLNEAIKIAKVYDAFKGCNSNKLSILLKYTYSLYTYNRVRITDYLNGVGSNVSAVTQFTLRVVNQENAGILRLAPAIDLLYHTVYSTVISRVLLKYEDEEISPTKYDALLSNIRGKLCKYFISYNDGNDIELIDEIIDAERGLINIVCQDVHVSLVNLYSAGLTLKNLTTQ